MLWISNEIIYTFGHSVSLSTIYLTIKLLTIEHCVYLHFTKIFSSKHINTRGTNCCPDAIQSDLSQINNDDQPLRLQSVDQINQFK